MFLQIRRFLAVMPWATAMLKIILNSIRFFFFYTRMNKCKLEKGISITKVGSISDENFFGYYNKSPTSEDGNILLTHSLINDECFISIVHMNDIEKIIPIVKTKAFNFQQGSMLQWIDNESFIFNDFKNNNLIARTYDIFGNNIHNMDLNNYVKFEDVKTFSEIHRMLLTNEKLLVFFSKAKHKIKKKAEQIACDTAIGIIQQYN